MSTDKPARYLFGIWLSVVRSLELVVTLLFAALVVVVLWGVVSRYTPGVRPSDWTEELAIYLLVWLSLLGAALAYRSHAFTASGSKRIKWRNLIVGKPA